MRHYVVLDPRGQSGLGLGLGLGLGTLCWTLEAVPHLLWMHTRIHQHTRVLRVWGSTSVFHTPAPHAHNVPAAFRSQASFAGSSGTGGSGVRYGHGDAVHYHATDFEGTPKT